MDSLRVATKSCNKQINMLTNKSEPQQKCRLGTVSKILLGGLNRFYRRLTSPSASIMVQNIQLFGYAWRFSNSMMLKATRLLLIVFVYINIY